MTIRKVFFSFAYSDVMRAMQVRKSNMILNYNQVARRDKFVLDYYDSADIEQGPLQQARAIQSWIDEQMTGTSVSCVLIGTDTHSRRWVKYEIGQSLKRNKGLVGIHINGINAATEKPKRLGSDPLEGVRNRWGKQRAETYDWVRDNGIKNLSTWIDKAWRHVRG